MKILIHALAVKKTGGSARHLDEFIAGLLSHQDEHQYILCLNAAYASHFRLKFPDLRIEAIEVTSSLGRFWWDQTALNRLAREEHCDVILALLSFGSLRPIVPQISFQRTPIYFCRKHYQDLRLGQKLNFCLRRWLLHGTIRASAAVITPTAAMRDSILSTFPRLAGANFQVIAHPFDDARFRAELDKPPTQKTVGEELRVLYVSQLIPYKGFDLIPGVAARLLELGVRSTWHFTGDREDWPTGYDAIIAASHRLGVAHLLHPLGRLTLEQAYRLYSESDIFFFPSNCESFGFPLLEAMGAGLPTVAADTAVNREICGSAALYFKADDIEDAAEKIREACHRRDELIRQAKTQFPKSFSTPHRYREEVLALAHHVSGKASGNPSGDTLGNVSLPAAGSR